MTDTALVTGGAGFIGSWLVDLLIEQGYRVVVIDDLSQSSGENLDGYADDPRLTFYRGSILDTSLLQTAMTGCSLVFHLAAVIGVRYIVDNPLHGIVTNVRGTENVLEAARAIGARVLIASSSEIYGRGIHAPLAEDDDALIGPTNVPRWSYAVSKNLDEHVAFAYHRQHGLPVSIVRYFNIYGPRCLPAGYGVIARFAERALTGQPLLVHGDGQQSRSFTYVSDAVRGTFLAGTMETAIGQAFNIGSARETTVAELAQLVGSLAGPGVSIDNRPYDQEYGPNFQDTRRRVPSVEKAARLLNFTSQVTLEDGVQHTLAWWRDRLAVRA